MMTEPKAGDHVRWKSHGGTAKGKVVKKVTAPMTIKGHRVAASPDSPQYLVETDEGKTSGPQGRCIEKT